MDLKITTEANDGNCIVAVEGEVDIHSAPQLERAITDAINAGHPTVTVDLSLVGFIDSSGLGALITALRQSEAANSKLILLSPQGAVERVLALTGLDKMFVVHNSVDESNAESDD